MHQTPMDNRFRELAKRYVDESPALSPVHATTLGDHRFDSQLDDLSSTARARSRNFHQQMLDALADVDRKQLSRSNQVDYALLQHRLETVLWQTGQLADWAWNPLLYTELAGSSIYGLMARDFAPLAQRLSHVADRLEKFPKLFEQIQATLQPQRVPRIHAETAVKQNRGVLSILDNMVRPQLQELNAAERNRLQQAMQRAQEVVEQHQQWLENRLLPNANGEFRLGPERYDEKLRFTLQTPLSRTQIRQRAESELARVREEMYQIAKPLYRKQYPFTEFPEQPTAAYRQAIIRACLEMAYQDVPQRDQIVSIARKSLQITTEFVKSKDLVTVLPDPLEIIVMPEFQRGIALAYCDSPGPLDVGQKTFYAVAPLPAHWTDAQVQSFLREYNIRSIHDLTVHEAMPGHFLQLAHSNRYPGQLRAMLASGVFIEGWAVYAEQLMANEGFLDGDPLMRLIALKWYLRGIANAILDQAIHTEGITREQAMRLMMHDTFQEEREAAGKWVRAQLTSAQLSTYFVGYLEHIDLRRETEQLWGKGFRLREYHDRLLSFGSPPVQYARALLLEKKIPQDR
tara:strand:+ start:4211 stop:5926 length:1716 start_codon:yes stop_codon:yes gene_type:complete